MAISRGIFSKEVFSWALYDFANTIYSMNIVSLYFAGWLIIDLGYSDITYSFTFSSSMFIAAILMPAFGYFSDRPSAKSGWRSQKKLIFLAVFTAGAVLSVIVFSLMPVSAIAVILVFFGLSNFFFEGGIVFYNSLLGSVSTRENVGQISGFGVAMGYVGSVVGMILVLPFVEGSFFSVNIPFLEGSGKSGAFLPTAIFFAIFAIPLFIFVREKHGPVAVDAEAKSAGSLIGAYKDIWQSLKSTKKYPGLLRFLIADYFIEDAIVTVIISMAVFTERILGITSNTLTLFLIVSTVCAVAGSYIFGLLADKYHPKRVLTYIVAAWVAVLIVFAFINSRILFWILGPIVGVLLGGVWAVSRPLLMLLAPKEKLGEFFGLFSISGRAAAICGPLIWGGVIYFVSNMVTDEKLPYRLAILALALMMAFGLFIFRKVPETKGVNNAR